MGTAARTEHVLHTRGSGRSALVADSVTSRPAQPQPVSSVVTSVTLAVKVIVSPGKMESRMRNFMRPSRPVGPVQSVTKRSNQAAWFGVFRKMSCTPLRSVANL